MCASHVPSGRYRGIVLGGIGRLLLAWRVQLADTLCFGLYSGSLLLVSSFQIGDIVSQADLTIVILLQLFDRRRILARLPEPGCPLCLHESRCEHRRSCLRGITLTGIWPMLYSAQSRLMRYSIDLRGSPSEAIAQTAVTLHSIDACLRGPLGVSKYMLAVCSMSSLFSPRQDGRNVATNSRDHLQAQRQTWVSFWTMQTMRLRLWLTNSL